MGRVKISIEKLPAHKINSTFSKRKKGLAKKAKDLGILCDCDVALIAISPKGDELVDVSHGGTIADIYQKYMKLKNNCRPQKHHHVDIPRDPLSLQHNIHRLPGNQFNGLLPSHPSVQPNDAPVQNVLNTLNIAQLNQVQQALQQRVANQYQQLAVFKVQESCRNLNPSHQV